jgi:hypothetical protein
MSCPNCNLNPLDISRKDQDFCSWACRLALYIRLESTAYLNKELKYPEYLEELKQWKQKEIDPSAYVHMVKSRPPHKYNLV